MSDQFHEQWGSTQIPYSQEAEEATLGAIQLNPEAFEDIQPILRADDFYILRHKYIWTAYENIFERHEPIDVLTVLQELKDLGYLTEIGGASYLNHLTSSVPTSVNVVVYAQIVERAATRRRLMVVSDHIKGLALNESMTVEDVIAASEQKLADVREKTEGESSVISISLALPALYTHVQERRNGGAGKLGGLSTGFRDWDTATDGLVGGNLGILAARTSMGKTALAANAAYNMSMDETTEGEIVFISMEMSSDELMARFAAMRAGIDSRLIARGKLNDQDWEKFRRAAVDLSEFPLSFDFDNRQTPRSIFYKCRKIKREKGLKAIFIDGLWTMQDDVEHRDENRMLGAITRKMKDYSRELDVPIIMLHQINRGTEGRQDKRPLLSDLKDSGSIEADADFVWLMYWDYYYNPGTAIAAHVEINQAKHRNGATGVFDLWYDAPTTRYKNAIRKDTDLRI